MQWHGCRLGNPGSGQPNCCGRPADSDTARRPFPQRLVRQSRPHSGIHVQINHVVSGGLHIQLSAPLPAKVTEISLIH